MPAPSKPSELVNPLALMLLTSIVALEPRLMLVPLTVTALLASLLLAILPANIVLVTVPESPVVITVPVVAGIVIVVVPAAALAFNTVVPLVLPLNVAPVPPMVGSVSVLLVKV